MRLRGITLDEFHASVDRVNADYSGNLHVHNDAHQTGSRKVTTVGRLDVLESKGDGARTTHEGRHGKYACWHAFRDVVRDLLAHHPEAVITTAMARYDAETFEDVYPATADRNVGSMVRPAYMTELCVSAKCDGRGE